ncbi:VOC family protein [Parasaccharibacter sp. TMW2.1882]|uniref:VOC family protein n=2 Tax=Acetobacteraceae TaxID=433 RepID=A0ABX4ZN96_9PROT|nr:MULTISPECIES: VOC family protein [Acetobacteraceae]MCL1562602.1 VOC family protein [Parasaccharibacter sp. TMW 2.1886]MCQ0042400.1 VOC family protein [Bombella sp.]MUG79364.1 VOC family protein [Bombella sp. ESL0380]QGT75030.1 VOC family protein [Bombella sp. ESL0368]MBE1723235.1 VOC family protein [Bombella apis]
MFLSHIVVGSNDLEKAKAFYDALFGVMGADFCPQDNPDRIVYQKDGQIFIITRPINGEAATAANGGTVGLGLSSPEDVRRWHEAGIRAGGTAVENPPGERVVMGMKLYLAYLRDPDGNKLCAFHKM